MRITIRCRDTFPRLGQPLSLEISTMGGKHGSEITAAELLAKLNADPVFVAARDAKEHARLTLEAELREVEADLIGELRAVGVDVATVWDLVNSADPYPRALPVLLSHMRLDYPAPVKDGIARALAVPETKDLGWGEITTAYVNETVERVKQGLAAAIAAAADDSVLSEVVDLVRDPRNGESRGLLLGVLKRSKDPRADAALMALCSEPQLAPEAQRILRQRRRRAW